MRKEYRSCLTTFAAVAGLVFAVTSSAIAWGLSDADYDYLRKTHNLDDTITRFWISARGNGREYTI